MRSTASILHLDMDAFFASVEQRDKPSLRGRPVIVGGVGVRGVVAAASYEARVHGVRSAMNTTEARRRCPNAAYLGGRFDVYRRVSKQILEVLEEFTPIVEPLALDEAYLDLGADNTLDIEFANQVRAAVKERTGGLACSVGLASSKLMAKIATGLAKPDGARHIQPGTEQEILAPLSVSVLPGVGPVTQESLGRLGVVTIADLRTLTEHDLIDLLGSSGGQALHRMARGIDHRPVNADRDAKSVSIEDTFSHDLVRDTDLQAQIRILAGQLETRMRAKKVAGRTIQLKVRLHDFRTYTRSVTLGSATDSADRIAPAAIDLLKQVDTSEGVRLLGIGVTGLTNWIQTELFPPAEQPATDQPLDTVVAESSESERRFWPGQDVHHAEHGDGWVWGTGLGRVTIRFETQFSGPGPVHTFLTEDPNLEIGHIGTVMA